MKLSNLSLAILVAVGVAACGGSDNNEAPKDPDAGKTPGGNVTPTPPTPPTPPAPKDPNASAPVSNEKNATVVDSASVETTKAAKQIFFGRDSRDTVPGYAQGDVRMVYQQGATDRVDIMRADSVINNYLVSGLAPNRPGQMMFNPVQTYVQGSDGNYYRVARVVANGALPTTWAAATVNSTFEIVGGAHATVTFPGAVNNGTAVPASALVYIPNVWSVASIGNTVDETQKYVPTTAELGTINGNAIPVPGHAIVGTNVVRIQNVNPNLPVGATNVFDVARKEVVPHTLHFSGKDYTYAQLENNGEIDFNLEPAQEIKQLPISFSYDIVDRKGTPNTRDDEKITRTAKAGSALVYNLNYSRAMVQINEAATVDPSAPLAAARNTLSLSNSGQGQWGAYQVNGRKTGTLPKNGRAVYTGKSFGVDTTGDIKLEADFGIDRASILGSVYNRVDSKKNALAQVSLGEILLSQPGQYEVTGSAAFGNPAAVSGLVHSADSRLDGGRWDVQLYGPNAENAGGRIRGTAATGGFTEVFSSARGDIQPKSLNN